MNNAEIAAYALERATVRLPTLDTLHDAGDWDEVVCKSYDIVELALKGLLRACGVEGPRIDDVAATLEAERHRLPASLAGEFPRLLAASRDSASESATRADADQARDTALFVVASVRPHIPT